MRESRRCLPTLVVPLDSARVAAYALTAIGRTNARSRKAAPRTCFVGILGGDSRLLGC